MSEALKKLREPFQAHQISKLPKETKTQKEAREGNRALGINCKVCGGWHHKDAIHLDYVGHAALTDRLLDVDPLWFWEPCAFGEDGLPQFDKTGGLWIRLHVAGHSRLGYGHAASATFKEIGSREKEVIGDALRNAAMRFGAALDLWHKGDLHLDEETKATPGNVAPQKAATKPITPNDAGKELWEAAETDQKSFLVDCLNSVREALETSPENASQAFYSGLKMDMDEQGAVWSQLNSKERAAIKSAKPQLKEAA